MRTRTIGFIFVVCLTAAVSVTEVTLARGGRGGGGFSGGGGGHSRPSSAVSRSPSMSRPATPSHSRPSSGPSGPVSGGAASRPATSRPGTSRPATGTRPQTGGIGTNRPSAGAGQGNRPSPARLDSFLNLPSSGTGRSNIAAGSRPAGANSAVADFLQGGNSVSPSTVAGSRSEAIAGRTEARAGFRDSRGENRDFASDNRQERVQNRGDQQAARVTNRGDMRSSLAEGRGENRSERQQQRGEQADSIRDELENEFDENHLFDDFWKDNPQAYYRFHQNPVFWTWATVGTFRTFFGPTYVTGGTSSSEVYYDQGVVYSGDEQIPAQEYAEQAEAIATSIPKVEKQDEMEWLPLGVFALAQQGNANVAPNMFLQLAVSKEGILAGTYQNKSTEKTEAVEGMVDPKSGRAAWTVAGRTTPIMETKLASLTENETNLLVHFADGTTQEWLMLHIEKPKESKPKESK